MRHTFVTTKEELLSLIHESINRVVHEENLKHNTKTLKGKQMSFPSPLSKTHPTKLDMIIESGHLNEGLIRTYPLEWVGNYLSPRLGDEFVHANIDYDKQHITFIVQRGNEKSIESLKRQMDSFGYYCAEENSNDYQEGVYLQFEPKYDIYFTGKDFGSRNNNVVFLHVSPLYYKDKILKKGLVPSCKNDYLKYPDRIYLIDITNGKRGAYQMADMLYEKNTKDWNDGTYAIFGITLDGLDNTKFYIDRNTLDIMAFYTYENIPPQNVKYLETFNVA